MSTIVSIIKVNFTSNYKGCHRLFWRRKGDDQYQGPVYAVPECSGSGNPCSISFSENITISNPQYYISALSVVSLLPNVSVQITTTVNHGVPLGNSIVRNICGINPVYYNQIGATLLANTANTFIVGYTGTGPAPAYVDGGFIRQPPNLGTLYYEGYVQACCEDEESITGRVDWETSYTPLIC
jgi:hypothetical protein